MDSQQFSGPDGARSRIRFALSALEDEIEKVAAGSGSERSLELGRAFSNLSRELALGPEPEVRKCPYCGQLGMWNAKVCGNCWAKLLPPDHGDSPTA